MSWRRVKSRQVSFLTRRLKSGRDMFLLILAMTLTLFMSSFLFETSGPASSSSSPSIWGKLILLSSPSIRESVSQWVKHHHLQESRKLASSPSRKTVPLWGSFPRPRNHLFLSRSSSLSLSLPVFFLSLSILVTFVFPFDHLSRFSDRKNNLIHCLSFLSSSM